MLNKNPVCVCDRISFVYCEKFVFKGETRKNGKSHQANTVKLAPERFYNPAIPGLYNPTPHLPYSLRAGPTPEP